jgi:hypothetical protein
MFDDSSAVPSSNLSHGERVRIGRCKDGISKKAHSIISSELKNTGRFLSFRVQKAK